MDTESPRAFPELRTTRFLLRRILAADRDIVFRALSDPKVVAQYGVSYATLEATQVQMNWFEEIFAQGTGVWWGICRPANPSKLLGAAGMNDLSVRHRRAELGYWLLPEQWGQGVARECVAAVLQHAYQAMHLYRVGAEVDVGNVRSVRLLRRLGFQFEGTRRGYESKDGRHLDLMLFARLASDPAPQQSLRESTMPRKLISSGSPFEEQIAYSRAVVDGEWIFVSGTTGFDYTTMTISDDAAEQAEQCLINIQHALRQADADLADVVRATYILPRAEDFEPCWPVLRRHFGEVRPAATMICAGLLDPRMKIEIEVTARRPRTPKMHLSKLAGFIIDCQTDDLAAAADFWSQALGMEKQALPGDEGDQYVRLVDPNDALHIEVQSVSHPSRVHLDIEADDIEAEVRRLEAIGARRVQQVQTWWVMEAPTGQRFCVVRGSSSNFDERARRWP